jgi:hypothetical protein
VFFRSKKHKKKQGTERAMDMRKTKKLVAAVLCLAMTFSLCAVGAAADFVDVAQDSPYEGAVTRLSQAGLVSGVGDQKFQPGTTVTTAELSVFLGRLGGASVDNSAAAASGLTADGWSSGYVLWAR